MPAPRAPAAAGDNTLEEIRAYVRRRFPLAAAAGDEDPLLDSGILDSLGILDLVAHLEKRFGIRVGDAELNPANFGTIASVARFVASKRG